MLKSARRWCIACDGLSGSFASPDDMLAGSSLMEARFRILDPG